MSFENLFMVNGVTVNENLRGQANDLYIEDAIQETTVATAGISAEYGRFSGGVVNVVTKSGGNFSRIVPRDAEQRQLAHADAVEEPVDRGRPGAQGTAARQTVPTHEYTLGGPVLKDRLWFFTAGRIQTQTRRTAAGRHQHSVHLQAADPAVRGQGHLLGHRESPLPGRLHEDHRRAGEQHVQHQRVDGPEQPRTRARRRRICHGRNYSGVLAQNLFVEGRFSERHFTFIGAGAKSPI